MVMMMILSYAITSYIDLKTTFYKEGRAELVLYFTLMAISCAIGIASGYVEKMPSPADLIKQLVLPLIGK